MTEHVSQSVPIALSAIRAFSAGYDCGAITGDTLGFNRGVTVGYERAVVEMTEVIFELVDSHYRDHFTDVNRAVVDLVVKRGPYADAARRRGQEWRASRQEQLIDGRREA